MEGAACIPSSHHGPARATAAQLHHTQRVFHPLQSKAALTCHCVFSMSAVLASQETARAFLVLQADNIHTEVSSSRISATLQVSQHCKLGLVSGVLAEAHRYRRSAPPLRRSPGWRPRAAATPRAPQWRCCCLPHARALSEVQAYCKALSVACSACQREPVSRRSSSKERSPFSLCQSGVA